MGRISTPSKGVRSNRAGWQHRTLQKEGAQDSRGCERHHALPLKAAAPTYLTHPSPWSTAFNGPPSMSLLQPLPQHSPHPKHAACTGPGRPDEPGGGAGRGSFPGSCTSLGPAPACAGGRALRVPLHLPAAPAHAFQGPAGPISVKQAVRQPACLCAVHWQLMQYVQACRLPSLPPLLTRFRAQQVITQQGPCWVALLFLVSP